MGPFHSFLCTLVIVNHAVIIDYDALSSLDTWPSNRYASIGAWGSQCWQTEKCVRLGNPGQCSTCGTQDGYVLKTLPFIQDYHNFNFQFYWSLKGSHMSDQCKFWYKFDDGDFISLRTLSGNKAVRHESLTIDNPGGVTNLTIRFMTFQVEGKEYCYVDELTINSDTSAPTIEPTANPTTIPTESPSVEPTTQPTSVPTKVTSTPTSSPTEQVKESSQSVTTTTSSTTQSVIVLEKEGEPFEIMDMLQFETLIIGALIVFGCLFFIFFCCLCWCKSRRKKEKYKLDTNGMISIPMSTATNIVSAESPHSPVETDGALPSGDSGNHVKGLSVFSNENTLKMWLESIGMTKYLQLFLNEGFGDELSQSEALSKLTSDDLKKMGIKKLAHRNIILSNVNKLGNEAIFLGNNHHKVSNVSLKNNHNHVTIDACDDDSDAEMDEFEFKRITSGNKLKKKKSSLGNGNDDDNESMYHRQMSLASQKSGTTTTEDQNSGNV